LLANVYLHYVFDLWVEAWRKKVAKGDVIVVRCADDLMVGFENRDIYPVIGHKGCCHQQSP
jgi:RNA-directed DNA polymerase